MVTDELAAQLLDKLVTLAGQVSAVMHDGLESLGLTEPLANLVWMLDPSAAPLPLRKLATRLHCDPSNISQLCAQLEERGFAERRRHPDDGRVRTVVLTAEGVQAREQLVALVTARSPLSALDITEQEQLHRMLTKALATL